MHYLRKAESPVPVRTLAEQLAAWEADREGSTPSEADEREAYAWLVTTHVPRLVEHDLAEYDERNETISSR